MYVCFDALCLSQHFFSHNFEKEIQKMKISADDIKNAIAQKGDYIREKFSSVGVINLDLRA